MPYLSDDDKTFFRENGYLVKHDLLSEKQLHDALDVVWQNLDCDRNNPQSWIDAGPNHPRIGAEPAIRATLYESPVFPMAEELVGMANSAAIQIRAPISVFPQAKQIGKCQRTDTSTDTTHRPMVCQKAPSAGFRWVLLFI